MKFADVIGQESVKEKLRHAHSEGRLAHALLLHGPAGCGNMALALAFVQFIACPNRTDMDSCGECPTCLKVDHLQFADLHFSFPFFNLPGETHRKTTTEDYMLEWRTFLQNGAYPVMEDWQAELTRDNKVFHISVYEAQHIIQRLTLKPYEGGYKFMVIWLPEFMSEACSNKLLKVVEEPPERTLFLFVSNNTENLLKTVISRVQMLHVPAIDQNSVVQALTQGGVEVSRAREIAHFTNGNWSQALRLSQSEDPNTFYANQFQQWMRLCYSRDVASLMKWCDKLHELQRDDQKRFLSYAMDQVRQNIVLNYSGPQLARMNDNEREFSNRFAQFINDTNVVELMDELRRAYDDISRNGYSKMVLLDFSLKTHHLLRRHETV